MMGCRCSIAFDHCPFVRILFLTPIRNICDILEKCLFFRVTDHQRQLVHELRTNLIKKELKVHGSNKENVTEAVRSVVIVS